MEVFWTVTEAKTGLVAAAGATHSIESATREAMHYAVQYAQDGPVQWHVKSSADNKVLASGWMGEPKQGTPGVKTYCCYSAYCEAGHDEDCPERPPGSPTRVDTLMPPAKDKPHAMYVEGYGYVDIKAVRAIIRMYDAKRQEAAYIQGKDKAACLIWQSMKRSPDGAPDWVAEEWTRPGGWVWKRGNETVPFSILDWVTRGRNE